MAEPFSKDDKRYFWRRLSSLEQERSSFISHWKELSEFIEPRKGRFFIQDRNKGERRNQKIINSRGTQALRSSTSGLFAGTMSPTKPWFKLEPLNKNLLQSHAVRKWQYEVEDLIRAIFLDSNFYSEAPVVLNELLLCATGAMSQIDDFDSVAHFTTHTFGSYLIGINEKGKVDTFVLDKDLTVKQIVEEFGIENVSNFVKDAYERNEYDKWQRVIQFIEPNPHYNPEKPNSENKKFRSVWFEYGDGGKNNNNSDAFDYQKFLRISGFDEFPVHVPRWQITGNDIYGTNCPGMVALGDIKALQIMEKRKAQAIDKLVNPPLKGPPSLTNVPISALPGGITLYDQDNTKEGLTALYQIKPELGDMRIDIDATERRINEAFYVDLFLAISNMEGIQPRNQLELSQRNAERLLMLGPPLQRIHNEFLTGVIERTFNQAVRANILPIAPPELQGTSLNIRFISSLAQAQRAAEVDTIERTALFTGQLASINPQVIDKIDVDEMVDQYSQLIGANPDIIIPDEIVIQVRESRAQQQAAMAEAQMGEKQAGTLNQGAQAVKALSESRNGR
jgi:hypothetical protein